MAWQYTEPFTRGLKKKQLNIFKKIDKKTRRLLGRTGTRRRLYTSQLTTVDFKRSRPVNRISIFGHGICLDKYLKT